MEQMLVTKGLNELKLLDSRINRKIDEGEFIATARQWGQYIPSIDNLFALSRIFNISIEEILVEKEPAKISFFIIKTIAI